ncbi:alpha/beta fold hydrolase [Aspergillus stella-maris]|uniref:alpha/beta fold hydrolase n=1 Tax=Aspergillus stella-maris TaxID=1810926 RepID=UPI003CCCC5FF
MSDEFLVLPRPGEPSTQESILAPSEPCFVKTFGQVLPPASYLRTANGRFAFYKLSPSSPNPGQAGAPSRVLLIHGVQTPAIGLQPLAKELSSRFPSTEFVLVDLWGHGQSDTPIAAHVPALFHALILDLLGHLNWPNAHFIGYSFGGSTAASFAAQYPEKVQSLTLVAPAGFFREEQFSELERSYLRGGEGMEEAAAKWILEFLEGGELVVPADWKKRVERGEVVAEAVRDWEMKNHDGHLASVVGVFRDGGVIGKHEEFKKVAKSGIRSLVVLGETDDVCGPKDLEEVGLKNVVVVKGVGHGVVRQRVDEVAGSIEEFWKAL